MLFVVKNQKIFFKTFFCLKHWSSFFPLLKETSFWWNQKLKFFDLRKNNLFVSWHTFLLWMTCKKYCMCLRTNEVWRIKKTRKKHQLLFREKVFCCCTFTLKCYFPFAVIAVLFFILQYWTTWNVTQVFFLILNMGDFYKKM